MKAFSALLLLLVCAACQQAPKSEPLFFGHTREYWRDLNEKFKAEDAAKQQKEWEDSAPQRQAQAERDAKEEREWRKQQAKQKAQEQAEAAKHFQSAEEYAQQLSAWRESQRQQQLKDAAELQAWRLAQLNQHSASQPTQANIFGSTQGIIAAGGRAQLFTPRDDTQDKLDAIQRQLDMQAEQAKLDAFRQHQIETAEKARRLLQK